ncbi:MAG: signal peptidase I [Rhodobacterales bacterium]|nr:MAG: signal peptidase I [Rhodobacterales bacterium]
MSRETSPLAPVRRWGRISGRLSRRGYWPLALIQAALIVSGLWLGSIWVLLLGLALFWPVAAASVRRLHDTGRSGWWLLLTALPVLGLVPLVFLLLPQTQYPTSYPDADETPLRRALFAAACLVVIGFSVCAKLFTVISSEMKPALLPGDVVVTSRLAYGFAPASCYPLRCPGDKGALPERGDIVAYLHPLHGKPQIGRVIGLPGEEITLTGGVPAIDGVALPQEPGVSFSETFGPQGPSGALPRCSNGAVGLGARCDKRAAQETLPNGVHYGVLDIGAGRLDESGPHRVPEGHVFILGDNRDNSLDSRVSLAAQGPGMVPADAIVGRVTRVAWSTGGLGWQLWRLRPGRTLEAVR